MFLSKFSSIYLAICLLYLAIPHPSLKAITTCEVFAKYPNAYFIETGTSWGNGVQMALDAGFDEIYSIELNPLSYEICRNRFDSDIRVTLIEGDSAYILPVLLPYIHVPMTFWLDGHYSPGNISSKGDTNTPILAELEAIGQHPIKTHTILIDDVRLFGTQEFDHISLDDIIQKILEINPNYTFFFEDGYVPNDVLVAKVL